MWDNPGVAIGDKRFVTIYFTGHDWLVVLPVTKSVQKVAK